jgi:hypothetical protein
MCIPSSDQRAIVCALGVGSMRGSSERSLAGRGEMVGRARVSDGDVGVEVGALSEAFQGQVGARAVSNAYNIFSGNRNTSILYHLSGGVAESPVAVVVGDGGAAKDVVVSWNNWVASVGVAETSARGWDASRGEEPR